MGRVIGIVFMAFLLAVVLVPALIAAPAFAIMSLAITGALPMGLLAASGYLSGNGAMRDGQWPWPCFLAGLALPAIGAILMWNLAYNGVFNDPDSEVQLMYYLWPFVTGGAVYAIVRWRG